MTRKKFETDSQEYAETIINTIHEPLIAMDQELRVLAVSRSFYMIFNLKPEEAMGQHIYEMNNKQLDIPRLREMLENVLSSKASFDNYEVENDFAGIGRRIILLNVWQIKRAPGKERMIFLAIEDITGRREMEETYNGRNICHAGNPGMQAFSTPPPAQRMVGQISDAAGQSRKRMEDFR
jgi:PAS domain S-box-containing protein